MKRRFVWHLLWVIESKRFCFHHFNWSLSWLSYDQLRICRLFPVPLVWLRILYFYCLFDCIVFYANIEDFRLLTLNKIVLRFWVRPTLSVFELRIELLILFNWLIEVMLDLFQIELIVSFAHFGYLSVSIPKDEHWFHQIGTNLMQVFWLELDRWILLLKMMFL